MRNAIAELGAVLQSAYDKPLVKLKKLLSVKRIIRCGS